MSKQKMNDYIVEPSEYHRGYSEALNTIWDIFLTKYIKAESQCDDGDSYMLREHLHSFLYSICKLHYGFSRESFEKYLKLEIEKYYLFRFW